MGDVTRYNPEDLFVSSISACHMLWYLHLCTVNGITVTSYLDNAQGTMKEQKDGSGHFDEVILRPEIQILERDKINLAYSLHEQANQMCFIANSCNFEIKHQPKVEVI